MYEPFLEVRFLWNFTSTIYVYLDHLLQYVGLYQIDQFDTDTSLITLLIKEAWA
jgi:hypothetical protein